MNLEQFCQERNGKQAPPRAHEEPTALAQKHKWSSPRFIEQQRSSSESESQNCSACSGLLCAQAKPGLEPLDPTVPLDTQFIHVFEIVAAAHAEVHMVFT